MVAWPGSRYRRGNSVKVLLTVYAKCLDGQRSAYNERITTLLGE